MKHLKKSFTLLMLLTSIIGSRTFAQDFFIIDAKLKFNNDMIFKAERAKEVNIGSRTFAQDNFNIDAILKFNNYMIYKAELAKEVKLERAKDVMQDSEYASTGYEEGIFLGNPLMLDGKPLDYGEFNLQSQGELTVTKGAAITGQTTQIPFYVYLRRNGNKVLIPGKERSDPNQIKIDISEILRHAAPGDQLVIEAVNKEDGPVKRILKLLRGGC